MGESIARKLPLIILLVSSFSHAQTEIEDDKLKLEIPVSILLNNTLQLSLQENILGTNNIGSSIEPKLSISSPIEINERDSRILINGDTSSEDGSSEIILNVNIMDKSEGVPLDALNNLPVSTVNAADLVIESSEDFVTPLPPADTARSSVLLTRDDIANINRSGLFSLVYKSGKLVPNNRLSVDVSDETDRSVEVDTSDLPDKLLSTKLNVNSFEFTSKEKDILERANRLNTKFDNSKFFIVPDDSTEGELTEVVIMKNSPKFTVKLKSSELTSLESFIESIPRSNKPLILSEDARRILNNKPPKFTVRPKSSEISSLEKLLRSVPRSNRPIRVGNADRANLNTSPRFTIKPKSAEKSSMELIIESIPKLSEPMPLSNGGRTNQAPFSIIPADVTSSEKTLLLSNINWNRFNENRFRFISDNDADSIEDVILFDDRNILNSETPRLLSSNQHRSLKAVKLNPFRVISDQPSPFLPTHSIEPFAEHGFKLRKHKNTPVFKPVSFRNSNFRPVPSFPAKSLLTAQDTDDSSSNEVSSYTSYGAPGSGSSLNLVARNKKKMKGHSYGPPQTPSFDARALQTRGKGSQRNKKKMKGHSYGPPATPSFDARALQTRGKGSQLSTRPNTAHRGFNPPRQHTIRHLPRPPNLRSHFSFRPSARLRTGTTRSPSVHARGGFRTSYNNFR